MLDIERTKQYYRSLKMEMLCDCQYCKNYYSQVKSEYPEVAEYLSSLGIDIEKTFETSPLEPDENGVLEYCGCQYIAFGRFSDIYNRRLDDVTVHIASSHPNTGL